MQEQEQDGRDCVRMYLMIYCLFLCSRSRLGTLARSVLNNESGDSTLSPNSVRGLTNVRSQLGLPPLELSTPIPAPALVEPVEEPGSSSNGNLPPTMSSESARGQSSNGRSQLGTHPLELSTPIPASSAVSDSDETETGSTCTWDSNHNHPPAMGPQPETSTPIPTLVLPALEKGVRWNMGELGAGLKSVRIQSQSSAIVRSRSRVGLPPPEVLTPLPAPASETIFNRNVLHPTPTISSARSEVNLLNEAKRTPNQQLFRSNSDCGARAELDYFSKTPLPHPTRTELETQNSQQSGIRIRVSTPTPSNRRFCPPPPPPPANIIFKPKLINKPSIKKANNQNSSSTRPNTVTVNGTEYQVLKTLGKGGCGEVLLVSNSLWSGSRTKPVLTDSSSSSSSSSMYALLVQLTYLTHLELD
jgi:hypothetical protein